MRKRGVGFLGMLFFFATVTAADATEKTVDNNHSSCESCHRMPANLITRDNLFPAGLDPSSVCLDCHHYGENHHPVNFVPEGSGGGDASLNSFPLFDGKVRCLTCHDAHGDGGVAGKPKLLRGGPYAYRTEICFKCHDADLNTRVNPHVMLDQDGGIREVGGEPVCLMCHASVPDQTRRGAPITFKADVAFLCWRCHPPMGGQFFANHFLVKPSRETLMTMRKTARQTGIAFPLLNRDRITCSTCHNPHQRGVLIYGSARAGAETHDRLRMPPKEICYGCHQIN